MLGSTAIALAATGPYGVDVLIPCLTGFEFTVLLLLQWLPSKTGEASLACYLKHS